MSNEKLTIVSQSKIELSVVLKLTEEEARALYSMTVYGHKAFTDWFYENLGKAYLKPHENGLISLFKTVGDELPQHLAKVDKARRFLEEERLLKTQK